MIRPKLSDRETQYRPQAGKTLRQALIYFITREFPRLGGPWVIELFVDKLLQVVDSYRWARDRLAPGQTVWPAVAVDESPGYRKSIWATRQVPVVVTVANQDDVAELRSGTRMTQILQRALIRAANDAYAQGGVLTMADLSMLFYRSHTRIAELIRQYEKETGQVVPRRGNVHDMGRTITHKHVICHKAYVEGKPTHLIAQETFHSPEAVDHYLLDFARVYFATVQRGMTPEQTAFTMQRPLSIIKGYVDMIHEFGLDEKRVYERAGVHLEMCNDRIELSSVNAAEPDATTQNERREQQPVGG
jgi:Protein of unknown function (DUF1670)